MLSAQGRATGTGEKGQAASQATISGHSGLDHEEPLLFERGRREVTGVDFPDVPLKNDRLGGLRRRAPIGLAGLSEPEAMRHYVRLSRKNASIDASLYPLGSCTMKHNPRLNEKMARLEGFSDIHPLQPEKTVVGAFGVIAELAHWLKTLTGMPAVAMSPKAGAHGELCGLLAIRAAIAASGETRSRILVPESAHGTNPATASLCGFAVENVAGTHDGRVDVELKRTQGNVEVSVAALQLRRSDS